MTYSQNKLQQKNCSETPASLHLCCKTYFNVTTPIVAEQPKETPKEEQPVETEEVVVENGTVQNETATEPVPTKGFNLVCNWCNTSFN